MCVTTNYNMTCLQLVYSVSSAPGAYYMTGRLPLEHGNERKC